jgi:hypothetical protein
MTPVPFNSSNSSLATEKAMQLSEEHLTWLVDEAQEDEVGLWAILHVAREYYGVSDSSVLRSVTMDAVQRLLQTGLVVAGQYRLDGVWKFDVWRMDTESILKRIDDEWTRLGHQPSIGDIVVFVSNNDSRPP